MLGPYTYERHSGVIYGPTHKPVMYLAARLRGEIACEQIGNTMAAAPETTAALIALVDWYDEKAAAMSAPPKPETAALFDRARAAIAKSKGEA